MSETSQRTLDVGSGSGQLLVLFQGVRVGVGVGVVLVRMGQGIRGVEVCGLRLWPGACGMQQDSGMHVA